MFLSIGTARNLIIFSRPNTYVYYGNFQYQIIFLHENIIYNIVGFWLCWGLTTRQPLWVILCRLPEKGRKSDRRDSRIDEREGQGRKRNRNESGEQKK